MATLAKLSVPSNLAELEDLLGDGYDPFALLQPPTQPTSGSEAHVEGDTSDEASVGTCSAGSALDGIDQLGGWAVPPWLHSANGQAVPPLGLGGVGLPRHSDGSGEEGRKLSHGEREKQRVQTISDTVDTLREVVPGCDDRRVPRAVVLQRTVTYILQVQQQLAQLAADLQAAQADTHQLKVMLSYYSTAALSLPSPTPLVLGPLHQAPLPDTRPLAPQPPPRLAPEPPPDAGAGSAAESRRKMQRVSRASRLLPWAGPDLQAPPVGWPQHAGRHPTLLYSTVPVLKDTPGYLGNTRALVGLCFFLLLSPTCKLIFNDTHITPQGPGRVLASTEGEQAHPLWLLLCFWARRAWPHFLLCLRSMVCMLLARVVLLAAEPAAFKSDTVMCQVQCTRKLAEDAFRQGEVWEAEKLVLQALALCGHQPDELTDFGLFLNYIIQTGHHQLRNWKLGMWVDSWFLKTYDTTPVLAELARLYYCLHLVRCFYRRDGGLHPIYLLSCATNYAEAGDSLYPGSPLLTQIYVSYMFVFEQLFPQFHYISRFYQHRALSRVQAGGPEHAQRMEEISEFIDARRQLCRLSAAPGLLIVVLMLAGACVIQLTTILFEDDAYRHSALFNSLMVVPTTLLFPLAVLTCFPP